MKPPFPNAHFAANLLRGTSPRDFPRDKTAIYLVALSDVPREKFKLGNYTAYVNRRLDLQLSSYLHAAGCWKGRGFATVIDDEALAAECKRRGIDPYPSGLGLVIHEAGHYLAGGAFDAITHTPAWVRRHIRAMNASRDFETYWRRTPHGDPHHGAVWVRATMHLHYRVNQLEPVDLQACRLNYGGFPDPNSFRMTLDAELKEHTTTPLVNLLREPPPRLFSQLWNELCGV